MFDAVDLTRIAAIQRQSPVRRVREIAEAVSAETCLPVEDILGASRVRILVEARQLVMHIAHREGFSYAAIGRAMGMDHTAVISGVRCERVRRVGAQLNAAFTDAVTHQTALLSKFAEGLKQ